MSEKNDIVNSEEMVCVGCEKPLSPSDDLVFCEECGRKHHRECWRRQGSCPSSKCTNTEYRRLKGEDDEAEEQEEDDVDTDADLPFVERVIVPNLRLLVAIASLGLPASLLAAAALGNLLLLGLSTVFMLFLLWYLVTDYELPEAEVEEESQQLEEKDKGDEPKNVHDRKIAKSRKKRKARKKRKEVEKKRKRNRARN